MKVLATIGTIILICSFIGAMIYLLVWDATNDAKQRQKECEEISIAAQGDTWREKSYNCLILKDGKVIYDK